MNRYFDVHLFDVAGTPITVATIVTFVLVLLVTVILSKVLELAAAKALRLRDVTDEGTIGVTRRLVHYLVLLLGLSVGLQVIGIGFIPPEFVVVLPHVGVILALALAGAVGKRVGMPASLGVHYERE